MGIHELSPERAVRVIADWVQTRQRQRVHVCTVHTVLECVDSPELLGVVNSGGLATPDGMPLVWVGRGRGLEVRRVYGPDLMLATCELGVPLGWRHYFYGGAPGVPEELGLRLQERFPGLEVAGAWSPPFRALTPEEESEVVARIEAHRPDLVWVGIGTPKQDLWMGRFRPRLQAPVLIGVGAAFDFHTGRLAQAPRWMQRSGLEWAYRLAREPRRLWRRYLLGNPRFVWLLWRQSLRRPRRSSPPD